MQIGSGLDHESQAVPQSEVTLLNLVVRGAHRTVRLVSSRSDARPTVQPANKAARITRVAAARRTIMSSPSLPAGRQVGPASVRGASRLPFLRFQPGLGKQEVTEDRNTHREIAASSAPATPGSRQTFKDAMARLIAWSLCRARFPAPCPSRARRRTTAGRQNPGQQPKSDRPPRDSATVGSGGSTTGPSLD